MQTNQALSEAIQLFLLDRKSYVAANTLIWYTQMLHRLELYFHGMPLADLNEQALMRFLVDQRERPREDGRQGKLSNVAVTDCVRAVRIFFRWCYERGLMPSNIAKHLKGPRSNHGPKHLTADKVKQMLAYLEDDAWHTASFTPGAWVMLLRDRALVLFMLDTGCRASETRWLKIGALNLKEGFAEIVGKGDKKRLVGLRPKTIAALRTYIGDRTEGRVFYTDDNKPLSAYAISTILRRLSKRIGIKVFPHMLRHTFGTLAILNGMDPSHLQVLMGHAQISTTQVYIKAARETAALRAHAQFSPVND